MKKRLLYSAIVMLFFVALFTINTSAKDVKPVDDTVCYFNPVLGACDTGGVNICYGVHDCK